MRIRILGRAIAVESGDDLVWFWIGKVIQDDPKIVRAYALLGMSATGFATLEFHIQFLLSFLHIGKSLGIETAVFTRRADFRQKMS